MICSFCYARYLFGISSVKGRKYPVLDSGRFGNVLSTFIRCVADAQNTYALFPDDLFNKRVFQHQLRLITTTNPPSV